MHEILEYLCLFMLIMIDVKLTPVVCGGTAYLFVWMGRRRAWLVLLLDWWVFGDSGATSSICFWSLSLGLWLGCRLAFYLTLVYVVEILPICRILEILFMDVCCSYDMYTWWCMTYIRWDCWWILYMHVVWILMWRCIIYFLNIYIIRVYYCFNRNKVLQHIYLFFWVLPIQTTPFPFLCLLYSTWNTTHSVNFGPRVCTHPS